MSDAQTSRVQTDAHTTQRSVAKAGGETEDEQAMARIRPVYCGNFEYDARQSEIERMFTSYGKVERVDMKTGMCFLSSLSLSLRLFSSLVHDLVHVVDDLLLSLSLLLYVFLRCFVHCGVQLFFSVRVKWGQCLCVCFCVLLLPISGGCFLVRRNSFKRFVSRLHYFAWICWAVNLCCFLLVWMQVGFGVSVFRSGYCLFVAIQNQEQGGIWNKIGFSDFCFIVIVCCVVCSPKTVS